MNFSSLFSGFSSPSAATGSTGAMSSANVGGGSLFGGFGGNLFNNQKPALGQMGNLFPTQTSGLDPKFSPYAYGQAPELSSSQIAGLTKSEMGSIGQIGEAKPGFDFSKLGGLLGEAGAQQRRPEASVDNRSRAGIALDPMYLMKYARQAQPTKLMPLGLLG
jgi:hypothetical protein